MDLALTLMASGATTRILGVLGFLVLLPLVIWVVARIGRRIVEKRHAREIPSEVKAGNDDEWLRRTIHGGS
jgi:hypothetical protein